MSEIVHDLLKEVEQLETATKELEKTSSQADAYHQELLNKKSEHENNIQLLNLEAIKAAQEAATLSQQAAQASLNQGQKLKAEIFEISEANFNWRQAIRNAAKEIKSAKSTMTIMMVVAIIFSLSAAGAAGYFAYTLQKQNSQLKGEVMDILATEHTLLKKNFALKIDELAYVVENMNSSLSKIAVSPAISAGKNMLSPSAPETIEQNITADTLTNTSPEATDQLSLSLEKEQQNTLDKNLLNNESQIEQNQEALNNEELSKIQETLSHLKNEVEKNNLLLTKIESEKSIPSATNLSNTSTTASSENSKKLANLSWLIRQQSKKITTLEKAITQLKSLDSSSQVSQMSLMVSKVQKQHSEVQAQLQSIKKSLNELTELSKEPPPYSYKAK